MQAHTHDPMDDLGLDYVESGEVQAVAAKLIDKHAVTFGHLRELTILYLVRMVDEQKPLEAKRIDALAKCVKAPAIWRDAFDVEVAIWVDERYWRRFTEHERQAVVMHELLHIGVNDAGKVKLLDHSVEEFGLVVATYGQWRPELERFARQMGLFDEDEAPPDEPTASNVVALAERVEPDEEPEAIEAEEEAPVEAHYFKRSGEDATRCDVCDQGEYDDVHIGPGDDGWEAE